MQPFVQTLSLLVPALFLVVMAAGLATLCFLFKGALQHRQERELYAPIDDTMLLKSDLAPDVALVAVAPDASPETMRFVRRLAGLHYAHLEIVIVLDGQSWRELDAWKQAFHLELSARLGAAGVRSVYAAREPARLIVVSKDRSGEADSLNAGISVVKAPVIATVDWDAQFSEDSLLRLIGPMIEDPEHTAAVYASAPVQSAPGRVARAWRLESARSWLCRRAGASAWNAPLPAQGAFLLFQRDALLQAGGFHPAGGTMGCALEMVLRLQGLAAEKDYRICAVTDPVSRPAPPRDPAAARRCAARDQMAIASALRCLLSMTFDAGKLSRLAIPGLLGTRLVLPLIETACLALAIPALVLGAIPAADLAVLALGTVMLEILVSMTAAILEPASTGEEIAPRELAATFFTAIPENLGHRQIRNLQLIGDFWRGLRAARRKR